MSAGFTPWSVETHELSEGFSSIVYDANGNAIADHLDEQTARLIAAAPELYATLEHVRELLVAYGPRYIEKATKLADAALAKARGDQ